MGRNRVIVEHQRDREERGRWGTEAAFTYAWKLENQFSLIGPVATTECSCPLRALPPPQPERSCLFRLPVDYAADQLVSGIHSPALN